MSPSTILSSATLGRAIGSTPVVELSHATQPPEGRLLAKLESTNPGGSLKDRAAYHIIEEAERSGLLLPGGTIIESSSGNFGLALAMVGAARGYRVIVIVDPKVTPTNKALFAAYGAEMIVVDEQDDSGSYHKTRIAYANRLHCEIPGSFRPDQCFNLSNSEAHFLSTAPEIHTQCDDLAAIVCTVSTGGQLGGIARYFRAYAPEVQVVCVDVHGSTVFGGRAHAYLTPGVGLSWTPVNLGDLTDIDAVYRISDDDAYAACRTLARREGLLAGVSTGAAFLTALSLAMARSDGRSVAFLAADRGERYLDTAFDAQWLSARGLSSHVWTVEELRRRAAELAPLSAAPARDCANFAPDLAAQLGSPYATRHPQRTP